MRGAAAVSCEQGRAQHGTGHEQGGGAAKDGSAAGQPSSAGVVADIRAG